MFERLCHGFVSVLRSDGALSGFGVVVVRADVRHDRAGAVQ